MPSLRDTQAAFAAALNGDPTAAAALVHPAGIAPDVRLGIYGNNAWASFRRTLELSFPAVRRLGGDDWFAGAAREYRASHPSTSGNLHHVGEHFAAFLASRLAGTGYEVIADVAALEWAYQEVLVAPDAPALDVGALAQVSERDYGRLHFTLHPACHLVQSVWPIVAVWQANRDEDAAPASVDLDAGADRVLLRRAGLEVEIHRLDAATFAFLGAVASGATLADAAERAFEQAPEFALAPALQHHVALAVLNGVRLPA